MRSFLLEYTKRERDDVSKETEIEIDIHVNLWGVNARKPEIAPIIDFGFMVENIKSVSSIILYCPFHIDRVDDLGGILSQQPDLIEAIFNEDCEVLSKIHPNRTKITKRGDNFKSSSEDRKEFILYKLDASLIEFCDQDEYGRVEVNVKNILSGNEEVLPSLNGTDIYYFRIRIHPKDNDHIYILKRENERINILQDSSLRTTEIIDFRINDFRSITENIKEEVFRLNTFNINSIHYLIMRSSTDEFISGSDKYKSRLLEREVWKDYIELNKNNDVIAYHFKEIAEEKNENNKKYISSFTNLSRFKYPLNVGKRMLCYVLIVILISVISNLFYDFFLRFFH
ncbi:hypothetical protein [Basfia succiniciproducens]|uniref:hypothetical protein n=1 Tax=Basfia succiniciproducens TaxID=653940 RepID=UPI000B846115|nr:hypothetical protein [Basfia succiniciproducens]QIM69072.1 hypothetical protein A4G13_06565 [Basfia succiniciproducens]